MAYDPASSSVELMVVHFGGLEDPRVPYRRVHPLLNILTMALCAVVGGSDGWDEIADFCRHREKWFQTFLDLEAGIPSADTFRRVFERLNPRRFEECFRQWVNDIAQSFSGEVVAVDGKSLRGALDKAGTNTPLHLVHVWATDQRLLLAQKAVAGAPGEVAAVSELLRLLDLKGAIVTADANSCTADVIDAIEEVGASSVLALKGNRGPIHEHVQTLFAEKPLSSFRGEGLYRTTEEAHGRREERVVRTLSVPDGLPFKGAWKKIRCVARVDRTRQVRGEKASTETHFYISTLPPKAERVAHAIRSHWNIENELHWSLDIAFADDDRKVRDARSAENLALLNRIALMLLKRENSKQRGLARKRKIAGWDTDYLARVLTLGVPIT